MSKISRVNENSQVNNENNVNCKSLASAGLSRQAPAGPRWPLGTKWRPFAIYCILSGPFELNVNVQYSGPWHTLVD